MCWRPWPLDMLQDFLWMPCSKLWRIFVGYRIVWSLCVNCAECAGTTTRLQPRPNEAWQPSVHLRSRLSCCLAVAIRIFPGKNLCSSSVSALITWCCLVRQPKKFRKRRTASGCAKIASLSHEWRVCMKPSSEQQSSPRQVMLFCYRRAAPVSMSSRILQNVEKGLEHGYWNFSKQSHVAFIRQKAGAQRGYSTDVNRGCSGRVWPDHAVFCFVRFFLQ